MIVISLGSNLSGPWGTPFETLRQTLEELERSNINIIYNSKLYNTFPQSDIEQPNFVNCIVIISTEMPAKVLMTVLKLIEKKSGRKPSKRWSPRTLDIDIIDYKHVVYNWKTYRPNHKAGVVLPHPRAHQRAFVLKPLSEIAPFWHHPVYGLTANQLLKRPETRRTGAIIEACS